MHNKSNSIQIGMNEKGWMIAKLVWDETTKLGIDQASLFHLILILLKISVLAGDLVDLF